MRLTVKLLALGLITAFAIYGASTLVSGLLDASHGSKAAAITHPFVSGALAKTSEKLWKNFQEIPDQKLQADGEALGRKMYPATKGIIKGHLDAFAQDPEKMEMLKQLIQTGKLVSADLLAPASEKLQDSTKDVFQELGKTLDGVRKFRYENRDLLEGLSAGLEALQKKIRETPLSAPPPPQESR